ncbi:MAG: hypothetical protein GY714_01915 [Desulfobacterales bacterium]|nr:hypothetical protein [Desulfobacterales bacterium]
MGAGCYYTLEENRDIKAYWVNIQVEDEEGYGEDDDGWAFEFVLDQLKETILELPICAKYGLIPSNTGYNNNKIYYGDMFIVSLDSTYYGDGILINFEFQDVDCEGLQNHNYEISYNKLIKHINKSFELSIATSGYTSATLAVDTIK